MDPRDGDPEEFELEPEPEEPAYRLPPGLFNDPFEDEGSASPHRDVFLSSLMGSDEPLTPPTMTKPAPAPPLRERLTRAVSALSESAGERRGRYAGADVSAPTFLDKLRRRRTPLATSAPAEVLSASGGLALDDPFARLLTPLGGPELAQLKNEVAQEEILFVRWERERRASVHRSELGVVFALLVLIVFGLFAGRGYLHHELVAANQPKWMAKRFGSSNTSGILFVLGLVLPFLTIGALADTFSHALKAIAERSIVDLLISTLSALFAASILLLLVHALPFQAAVVLVAWLVFRVVINLLNRFRGL